MKQYGIRKYISSITLIPLVIMTVSLEFIFLVNYFAELDQHSIERGKLLANQFASSSEYGVASNNLPFLENITRHLIKETDASGALILNSRSEIMINSGLDSISFNHSFADSNYQITGKTPVVTRYGKDVLQIYYPIIPEAISLNEYEANPVPKPIGMVVVEMSLARTEKSKVEILWYTLATTFGFLAFMIFLIVLASRRITNPITLFSSSIQKIAKGDLSSRIQFSSNMREINALSNGINYMAEQLQDERRRLQEKVEAATLELRHSKENAERANQAKSQFLADASHDLRQPLHALGLFASALNERIKNPEDRLLVDNINRSVAALEELFNSLLDISRLDAGVIYPKQHHFRIFDLMDRLSTDFNVSAYLKGLDIQFKGADLVAYSDPVLLETMLRNLISNAIRYTESGEVGVIWFKKVSQICIQVSDTGIGIPEEKREQIFQEFMQLNNPDRDRTKGFGLGLAIVKRLSQLLKSSLTIKSTVGSGSIFQLNIPLGDKSNINPNKLVLEQQLKNEPSMLILVIDDDNPARESMTQILKAWGHEVVSASSLHEALGIITRTPDAIIADYRLRDGKTGIEAASFICQSQESLISTLIVTGDNSNDIRQEANRMEYALLLKPVNSAKLRAFLRSVSRIKKRAGLS